jgi:hypothetical protein
MAVAETVVETNVSYGTSNGHAFTPSSELDITFRCSNVNIRKYVRNTLAYYAGEVNALVSGRTGMLDVLSKHKF